MSNNLLDDNAIIPNGVMIKKHHIQARLAIFFYTLFLFFYLIVMSEYSSLDIYGFLEFGGKLMFFGFLIYYNFKQLTFEKIGALSYLQLPKIQTMFFLLFIGILLIHSIFNFIDIISINWYQFSTLVFFCIILSILGILSIELKYLFLKRKARIL